MKTFALLIGISYHGTAYQLAGCVPDVDRVEKFLRNRGITDIVRLDDKNSALGSETYPSRTNVVMALFHRIRQLQTGDRLFVQFSGHGFYTSTNGGMFTKGGARISDATQECILLRNPVGSTGNNIDVSNTVCDAQITQLLATAPTDSRVMVCVDACHSGGMFDMAYNLQAKSGTAANYVMREGKPAKLPNHVAIFTAVRLKSYAWDVSTASESYGVFTKFFIDLLEECVAARKPLSYLDALHLLQKRIDRRKNTQDPQLSVGNRETIDGNVWLLD